MLNSSAASPSRTASSGSSTRSRGSTASRHCRPPSRSATRRRSSARPTGIRLPSADDAALGAALAEWGGRIVTGYAEGGEGRLVVQLPPSADVRAVVETLDSRYGAQLLARREHARETEPRGWLDALTDRQQTVLETAFHAGYFDSPRANTGGEVAESLDISTPTLHEHLRAAERKLMAASLGEDD